MSTDPSRDPRTGATTRPTTPPTPTTDPPRDLPPVALEVAAAAVEALTPRLRKRLAAAVEALGGPRPPRPAPPDGSDDPDRADDSASVATTATTDTTDSPDGDLRVATDGGATVTLTLTGGAVTTAEHAVCDCLLAPRCLHRAAVLTAAPPLTEPARPDVAPIDSAATDSAAIDATATGTPATDTTPTDAPPANSPAAPATTRPAPAAPAPPNPDSATPPPSAPTAPRGTAVPPITPTHPPDDPSPLPPAAPNAPQPALTPARRAAARELFAAAADLLAAGARGVGAALTEELVRAAHTARAAGLHRASAAALRVVRQVRRLHADDPQFRLPDLVDDLVDLLLCAHLIGMDPPRPGHRPDELIGTARRTYHPVPALRLHGLCALPLITASGHAGVVVYALTPEGGVRTVSDVAPGGADRVAAAARAAVPVGRAALPLAEFARSGLRVTGATESPDGRIGNPSTARAVRTEGTPWTSEPFAARWREPLAEQVARALEAARLPDAVRPAGHDLLFLAGRTAGAEGDALLLAPESLVPRTRPEASAPPEASALCSVVSTASPHGAPVRLIAPDAHPSLPFTDNLRVLAEHPGLPLLAVATLDPARPRTARLISVRLLDAGDPHEHLPSDSSDPSVSSDPDAPLSPPVPSAPVDLGLTRLRPPSPRPPTARAAITPADATPFAPSATGVRTSPLHHLERAVQSAATGGRAVTAVRPPRAPRSDRELRALPTAAALLHALAAAAAREATDAADDYGRLLPGDPAEHARRWLAAAVHLRAASAELALSHWR